MFVVALLSRYMVFIVYSLKLYHSGAFYNKKPLDNILNFWFDLNYGKEDFKAKILYSAFFKENKHCFLAIFCCCFDIPFAPVPVLNNIAYSPYFKHQIPYIAQTCATAAPSIFSQIAPPPEADEAENLFSSSLALFVCAGNSRYGNESASFYRNA